MCVRAVRVCRVCLMSLALPIETRPVVSGAQALTAGRVRERGSEPPCGVPLGVKKRRGAGPGEREAVWR